MRCRVERSIHIDPTVRRDFDRVVTILFLFGIVVGGVIMLLFLGSTGHLS